MIALPNRKVGWDRSGCHVIYWACIKPRPGGGQPLGMWGLHSKEDAVDIAWLFETGRKRLRPSRLRRFWWKIKRILRILPTGRITGR